MFFVTFFRKETYNYKFEACSMRFESDKYSRFFHRFRAILLCIAVAGAVIVMMSSCSGSKKSASIKKIERESKKDYRSKEVRKAEEQQEKQQKEAQKAAEKAHRDGITRHREFQTQEVRNRMDANAKESDKKYKKKKDFFLVRWFRPKDDIEKIEKKRAKEVEKRMAATRKKAEKNNDARSATNIKTKERKASRPDPADFQHGGGGSYEEGRSKSRANPADIQHGGGGTYPGGGSKNRVSSSDFQHGGGGSMPAGKAKKVKAGSENGNTKGTSPRKNRFSKKAKPIPGE